MKRTAMAKKKSHILNTRQKNNVISQCPNRIKRSPYNHMHKRGLRAHEPRLRGAEQNTAILLSLTIITAFNLFIARP